MCGRNLKHDGIFAIPFLIYGTINITTHDFVLGATKLGAFLPIEPRSRYEKLMHINEQNPRLLLHQLKKHFKHVLLWFGAPEDPAGSLIGPINTKKTCSLSRTFSH